MGVRHKMTSGCSVLPPSIWAGFSSPSISLYPLLLIVSTALKDPLDVTANPFALFSSVNLMNFVDAWTLGGFGGYFWNTSDHGA